MNKNAIMSKSHASIVFHITKPLCQPRPSLNIKTVFSCIGINCYYKNKMTMGPHNLYDGISIMGRQGSYILSPH